MIIFAEFLMACGLAAIVGALLFSGYRIGKQQAEEKDKDA